MFVTKKTTEFEVEFLRPSLSHLGDLDYCCIQFL